MSQFFFNNDNAPGTIDIVSLTPDSGTTPVVPTAAGNVTLVASSSDDFSESGITTVGGTNTLTVTLTNRKTGQVTTTDASTTNIISLALGAVESVYAITGYITPMIKSGASTGDGASYYFDSAFRTDGATATKIASDENTTLEDVSLESASITLTVSGGNALLNVIGLAGTTINWDAIILFRRVI